MDKWTDLSEEIDHFREVHINIEMNDSPVYMSRDGWGGSGTPRSVSAKSLSSLQGLEVLAVW